MWGERRRVASAAGPDYTRRRLAVLLVGSLVLTGAAFALTLGDGPFTDAPPPPTTAATASTAPTAMLDAGSVAPTDVFVVATGAGPVTGSGELSTYTVEVERGVPFDLAEFARAVEQTLADSRGWTAAGNVALQRVGAEAEPTFRVRLATPATTDAHCAPLDTLGEVSCRNGADVMINLRRWLEGAAPSEMALGDYRSYVISHEVGHALGHDHVGCPGAGLPSPVMAQQTLGLGGCTPNPWPYPDGVP
jgi:Protein of unknown function (DUF3152)